MNLFISFFKKEFDFLVDNEIKVVFSGRDAPLPKKVIEARDSLVERTKDFTGMTVNICLNYFKCCLLILIHAVVINKLLFHIFIVNIDSFTVYALAIFAVSVYFKNCIIRFFV